MNNAPIRKISGLEQIHRRYDALLVDAWGVLHDGRQCHPDVVDCLQRLRALDLPVIVLSNAARRVPPLRDELRAVGIDPSLYRDILSSGELCWQALRARSLPFTQARRACYFGPARSRSICDGLDYDWRDDPDDCAFVLNTGAPHGNPADAEGFRPLLQRLLALDLPMICANPDRVAVRAGEIGISAGAIAHLYQRMGAPQVHYFGKPRGAIYQQALERLGAVDPRRLLAVGDGFATDIAGAAAFGLDSLLITGGIHATELARGPAGLEKLVALHGARPTWVCDRLRWSTAP